MSGKRIFFSNAVKYTPDGGRIHVDVEELPSEREGYAVYRTVVSDTGIGIDKKYIPHLFESFSREKICAKNLLEKL